MKKIILLLLLLCNLVAFGQEERYTLINGKRYAIHRVEKGHTLYSISKKYAVPLDYILESNPGATSGIQVGEELKVPVYRQDPVEAKDNPPEIRGAFLIHTVKRKETLFSLSRKYGVSMSDIESANPEVRNGLKVGSELRIPVEKVQNQQKAVIEPAGEDGRFQIHKVEPRETLYSLSKQYGVSVGDIKKANGGMPEGLQKGTTIRIPNAGTVMPETEEYAPTEPVEARPDMDSDDDFDNSLPGWPDQPRPESFHVALMLPFEVEKLEELEKLGGNQIALEFYLGARIALDSMKNAGMNVNLHVYDTRKNANHVKSLMQRPEMRRMHLFIGPMYRSALEEVTRFAAGTGAHVVCPVPQSLKVLMDTPYLTKVACAPSTQMRYLGRYVAVKYPEANVLAVMPPENQEKNMLRLFNQAYQNGQQGRWRKDSLRYYSAADNKLENLEAYLREEVKNVVYIPSNDVVFVSNALTTLHGFLNDYDITVMGHESWLKYTQIETEYKNNLHLTLPATMHTDYHSISARRYLKAYRHRYNTYPNHYGLMGFDITYYYLKGLYENGLSFTEEYPPVSMAPTSTKFRFKRYTKGAGFENYGSFILTYEDYELKSVY